jgi:hypothetical protein
MKYFFIVENSTFRMASQAFTVATFEPQQAPTVSSPPQPQPQPPSDFELLARAFVRDPLGLHPLPARLKKLHRANLNNKEWKEALRARMVEIRRERLGIRPPPAPTPLPDPILVLYEPIQQTAADDDAHQRISQ